jgi:hypothetical protein
MPSAILMGPWNAKTTNERTQVRSKRSDGLASEITEVESAIALVASGSASNVVTLSGLRFGEQGRRSDSSPRGSRSRRSPRTGVWPDDDGLRPDACGGSMSSRHGPFARVLFVEDDLPLAASRSRSTCALAATMP